jgi:hypothetical protein
VALIKNHFNIIPTITHGKTGQFEVRVDGERVVERGGNWFTRRFGAGYPDLDSVVDRIRARTKGQ